MGAEVCCTSRCQDPRRSSREEREKEREIGGVGACALQRRAKCARACAGRARAAGQPSLGEREREKAKEGTERGWAGDPLGALTSNGY